MHVALDAQPGWRDGFLGEAYDLTVLMNKACKGAMPFLLLLLLFQSWAEVMTKRLVFSMSYLKFQRKGIT